MNLKKSAFATSKLPILTNCFSFDVRLNFSDAHGPSYKPDGISSFLFLLSKYQRVTSEYSLCIHFTLYIGTSCSR